MFDNTFKTNKKQQDQSFNYTILNNRFTLEIPQEWEDHSIYRFDGPINDGIKHNIIITIENNVEVPNLQHYVEMNIKTLKMGLQGYIELKQAPFILNNGISAYELVYKWIPVDNREVYQKVIYILINKTGYILSATFSKKTWKTMGPEVDKILKSFTVT